MKKASHRIFIIRNLRKGGCPKELMKWCYISFIRSVLLYAFQCVCKAPLRLLNLLDGVERCVARIIGEGRPITPSLHSVAGSTCRISQPKSYVSPLTLFGAFSKRILLSLRLFENIKNDDNHVLHALLPQTSERSGRLILPHVRGLMYAPFETSNQNLMLLARSCFKTTRRATRRKS